MALTKSVQAYVAPNLTTQESALKVGGFDLDLKRLLMLGILNTAAWLLILSYRNSVGVLFGVFLVAAMLLISLSLLGKNVLISLSILLYLSMVEPGLRTFLLPLPYFTLEYFFIIWAVLLLFKSKSIHLYLPAVFYMLYLILEVSGLFTAISMDDARAIFVPSLNVGLALLLVNKVLFSRKELLSIIMSVVLGTSGLITIIAYRYATSPKLVWSVQSNFAASGGMGPVQISMLLAVGIIFLLILADRASTFRRLVYIVLAAGIGFVMTLTFSRNGLYLVVLGLCVYYLVFSKFSLRTVLIIGLLSVFGIYLFKLAVEITDLAVIERYSIIDTTGRDLLAGYGWQIFLDNSSWGVGTGNFYSVVVEYFGKESGAHNELIRAAAEHGILGLSLWVLFAVSSIWMTFKYGHGKARAIRMTILTLFIAYLAVNGLKLLIQPLLLLVSLTVNDF